MANLNTNLQRLSDARDDIYDAIIAKGGTAGEYDGFEDFASDIETIPGGSNHNLPIPNVNCKPVSNKYTYNTITVEWVNWNGLSDFYGSDIWTDGNNIYYSSGTTQYTLDKNSTRTWITKTWNGLTNFSGGNIWTDGENIYFSSSTNQYVLNKSTSTWNTKTWSGLTDFSRINIWTDGENIYYSYGTTQKVLNKSTSTWQNKTWNGLTNFSGGIWTDGDNIYYSSGSSNHYVLDKTTSTWSAKTWYGLPSAGLGAIWTDGDNIYSDADRMLNKSTSTWIKSPFYSYYDSISNIGSNCWTDGNDIYYNYGSRYRYIIKKIESQTETTSMLFPITT